MYARVYQLTRFQLLDLFKQKCRTIQKTEDGKVECVLSELKIDQEGDNYNLKQITTPEFVNTYNSGKFEQDTIDYLDYNCALMLQETILGYPVYIITNDVSKNTFIYNEKAQDPLLQEELKDNLFKMRRL